MSGSGWGAVAGLSLGALVLGRRVLRRRQEQLACRLDNGRLSVLVVGQGPFCQALTRRLANACLAVDWIADSSESAAAEAVRRLGDVPPRMLAAPDAAAEYDLALVVARATELSDAALHLRSLEATPVLVVSRHLGAWPPYAGLFTGTTPLIGVPALGGGGESRRHCDLWVGEADGAHSQRLTLARRLLSRAGLGVRRCGAICQTLRQHSALVAVQAMVGALAGATEASADGHGLADAASVDAGRLLDGLGIAWDSVAKRTAAHWLRQAPTSADELALLSAQLLALAREEGAPVPIWARVYADG